jgi:hypothetical protein
VGVGRGADADGLGLVVEGMQAESTKARTRPTERLTCIRWVARLVATSHTCHWRFV